MHAHQDVLLAVTAYWFDECCHRIILWLEATCHDAQMYFRYGRCICPYRLYVQYGCRYVPAAKPMLFRLGSQLSGLSRLSSLKCAFTCCSASAR